MYQERNGPKEGGSDTALLRRGKVQVLGIIVHEEHGQLGGLQRRAAELARGSEHISSEVVKPVRRLREWGVNNLMLIHDD